MVTKMKRIVPFAGGIACVGLIGLPAGAADLGRDIPDLCAVSGVNGKFDAAGGFVDGKAGDGGRAHVLGSISMPLSCAWAVQLDAGIGDFDGKTSGGVAAHVFTRDPSSYLLGVYTQYGALGSEDIWRVGAEASSYLGNISLDALVGVEDTDKRNTDLFAALTLGYYPQDNLRLDIGYYRFLDIDSAGAGFEYLLDNSLLGSPVSLFAVGAVGDRDYATVFGGVRVYFGGPDKSLIRRHREDDPSALPIFQLLNENAKTSAPVVPVVTDGKVDPKDD